MLFLVTKIKIRYFEKVLYNLENIFDHSMNKIFTRENKIFLVNNVEELTIPKINVFLFVHDIIVKENTILENFLGVKEAQNLM